jgi:hypothetical protein
MDGMGNRRGRGCVFHEFRDRFRDRFREFREFREFRCVLDQKYYEWTLLMNFRLVYQFGFRDRIRRALGEEEPSSHNEGDHLEHLLHQLLGSFHLP